MTLGEFIRKLQEIEAEVGSAVEVLYVDPDGNVSDSTPHPQAYRSVEDLPEIHGDGEEDLLPYVALVGE